MVHDFMCENILVLFDILHVFVYSVPTFCDRRMEAGVGRTNHIVMCKPNRSVFDQAMIFLNVSLKLCTNLHLLDIISLYKYTNINAVFYFNLILLKINFGYQS